MTNILDGMAILPPIKMKEKCPICGKSPHDTTTAKKEDKGCLKSIPKNLGCTAIPLNPELPNYATAAHHLIPAIQCLSKFPRLSQMCKAVGYDVNNKQNGIALPTCGQQQLNKYTEKKVKYSKLSDQDKQNVAFQIMEGLNLQWHVGHHNWVYKVDEDTDKYPHPENYDKLVKIKLRDIELEISKKGESICEPPKGEKGEKVISRMNSLSGKIRGYVVSWDDFFVSAMSCKFAETYRN